MNILRKENEGAQVKQCYSPWVTVAAAGCLRGTTEIQQKVRSLKEQTRVARAYFSECIIRLPASRVPSAKAFRAHLPGTVRGCGQTTVIRPVMASLVCVSPQTASPSFYPKLGPNVTAQEPWIK